MDKKQEDSRELLRDVISLLENNKLLDLRELLEEYHIMDIFDVMENLDEDMKIKLFEVLPIDMSASILEESGPEFFRSILSNIDQEHGQNILEQMSLDDLTDILSEIDEDERHRIMNLLSKEDADDVKELLVYDEDSAGGIMTTGYIEINKNMTAKEAIDHMRENALDAETIYYIYVVDNDEKLVGVLSLRELITARDSVIVEDLMSENIISIDVDEDREEAVRLVSKYDLIAIPVIDKNGVLKGIITVDDIIDVMEEEASEDLYKLAGSSEHERDVAENQNATQFQQVTSSVRARIPWLIIILIMGLLSTILLTKLNFIGYNSIYVKILIFLPVILCLGGGIGMQSSSITIMTLSNKDVVSTNNILKEVLVGLITGTVCGLIGGIGTYIIINDNKVALLVGVSILINMIFGATIGAFVPNLLKKLDIDTSIVSAPLVSVILDFIGICIFFLITTSFL
ncbi:MAG: magnesium transporter [Clostridiales bacterium]|uniref:magnesium transporter n=1 Tax=Terrisporobacter sp. TaxID=1965305 RepID=UPI002A380504|nr:magnesium transporter [Terrisporobacter sp.]MCI7204932.1 magnesium transporter [Clostridium sp.]MDD5878086.1 magnesium transporter [Clostridiales bacterium]MDD7753542.1 magnesium transporter [Clostridiales bacterium]MDY4136953.1 magnesium transporter [Terrisporobacter sp.]MDY6152725.1 magnesium transporter [Terrisporobacter sp.]